MCLSVCVRVWRASVRERFTHCLIIHFLFLLCWRCCCCCCLMANIGAQALQYMHSAESHTFMGILWKWSKKNYIAIKHFFFAVCFCWLYCFNFSSIHIVLCLQLNIIFYSLIALDRTEIRWCISIPLAVSSNENRIGKRRLWWSFVCIIQ